MSVTENGSLQSCPEISANISAGTPKNSSDKDLDVSGLDVKYIQSN